MGAVGSHRGDVAGDLIGQGADLGEIALVLVRQLAGQNFGAVGIDRQMQLPPAAPVTTAVLLPVQFAAFRPLRINEVKQGFVHANIVFSFRLQMSIVFTLKLVILSEVAKCKYSHLLLLL